MSGLPQSEESLVRDQAADINERSEWPHGDSLRHPVHEVLGPAVRQMLNRPHPSARVADLLDEVSVPALARNRLELVATDESQ